MKKKADPAKCTASASLTLKTTNMEKLEGSSENNNRSGVRKFSPG
jgi:hypothetical protein